MPYKRKEKTNRPMQPQKSPKRSFALRLFFWIATFVFFLSVLVGIFLTGLFFYYGSDSSLPRIGAIHEYNPKIVTKVFDRHGILIGEISDERRTVVQFTRIPKLLVNAVVAAEDADFFKHSGLDYMGMLRAFWANLRAGRYVQGGSTITQQVVKTFFLSPARTLKRKIQEVILARRLESELSKDEIISLYLNQIYFGHGRYGIQEASRFFFDKDVKDLDLAQAAMLAGLPQSPERLSPLKHPDRAKKRQVYVLNEMVRCGYVHERTANLVAQQPIKIVRKENPYYNSASEVMDIVRAELVEKFGEGKLSTLGLNIRTTVDAKMQLMAKDALRWGLRSIDARHGYRGRIRTLKGKSKASLLRSLSKTQKDFEQGKHYRGIVIAVDDLNELFTVDLGSRSVQISADSERYNPQKHVPSKWFVPGDLIEVRFDGSDFVFDGGPQGAMVVMDPKSGDILAMVGGYDFLPGQFNRATQALRQPGSAFKPIVYGAALETGKYTPASIIDDSPVVYKGWVPQNFDGQYRGPIRLRVALTHSINSVAAKLIADIGVEKVRDFAQQLGITTPLENDLSLALGSSSVLPIDLTTVYCAFANGGRRVFPRVILEINKSVVHVREQKQIFRPEVAFVLTNMMQSVVTDGTARMATRLNRPVAGKTGTTNQQKDAWFAGFVPQMVAVVWVGFDTPRSLGQKETGGRAALSVWVRFMRTALQGLQKLPFSQPSGVVVQKIDPKTGLLAREGSPDGIEETFVEGTAPTEYAPTPDQVDPNTVLMDTEIP